MARTSCASSAANSNSAPTATDDPSPEPVSRLSHLLVNNPAMLFLALKSFCELKLWWVFLFFLGLVKKREKLAFAIGKAEEGCDVFDGRWVRDEANHPLYEESECPYIQPQLTCQEHGRPEKEYQYWRWQPNGCDLPRSVSLPSFSSSSSRISGSSKRRLFSGVHGGVCFSGSTKSQILRKTSPTKRKKWVALSLIREAGRVFVFINRTGMDRSAGSQLCMRTRVAS